MASKIEICNLALNRIAANTIISLTDSTQSARAVALVYDQTLAEMLEKHHWNFARIRRTLSPLVLDDADRPPHWAYAFARPADMAKFMYFEGRQYGPGAVHDIAGDRIFSNAADGTAIYTARITDTAKFPAGFTAAFVEALAARLIMPIKGDERRYIAMRDAARRELNMAIAQDLNNQDMSISAPSIFERARRS